MHQFKSYECKCLSGTGGTHCDQIVKKCTNTLCGSNGKCVDLPDHKYKCVCKDGYIGDFCETMIDICYPNPCLNNGVCTKTNNINEFSCKCSFGYTGATCNVSYAHHRSYDHYHYFIANQSPDPR